MCARCGPPLGHQSLEPWQLRMRGGKPQVATAVGTFAHLALVWNLPPDLAMSTTICGGANCAPYLAARPFIRATYAAAPTCADAAAAAARWRWDEFV